MTNNTKEIDTSAHWESCMDAIIEQEKSRLENLVRLVDISSERTPFDDTRNQGKLRRWIFAEPLGHKFYLDTPAGIESLRDPANEYVNAMRMAVNRLKDDLIIDALGGGVFTGKKGTSTVALPSAQAIPHNNQGFTFQKMKDAVRLLELPESDDEQFGVSIAWAYKQEHAFIDMPQTRSVDYNTERITMSSQVTEFPLVHFMRTNRLPINDNIRDCYVWRQDAIKFGFKKHTNARVSENSDGMVTASAEIMMGAVRMNENNVVKIECLEK